MESKAHPYSPILHQAMIQCNLNRLFNFNKWLNVMPMRTPSNLLPFWILWKKHQLSAIKNTSVRHLPSIVAVVILFVYTHQKDPICMTHSSWDHVPTTKLSIKLYSLKKFWDSIWTHKETQLHQTTNWKWNLLILMNNIKSNNRKKQAREKKKNKRIWRNSSSKRPVNVSN